MMTTRCASSLLAGGVLVWLTGGCSDIEVGSAWAPQTAARSSPGDSFAWAPVARPGADDLRGLDPEVRDLIRSTVEQGFIERGYRQTAPEQADFWLRCGVGKETRGDAYSSTFEQYTEGTLLIYVVNPATGDWTWRGWGNARLNAANPPEEKRARLQEAVKRMLEGLPATGQAAAKR